MQKQVNTKKNKLLSDDQLAQFRSEINYLHEKINELEKQNWHLSEELENIHVFAFTKISSLEIKLKNAAKVFNKFLKKVDNNMSLLHKRQNNLAAIYKNILESQNEMKNTHISKVQMHEFNLNREFLEENINKKLQEAVERIEKELSIHPKKALLKKELDEYKKEQDYVINDIIEKQKDIEKYTINELTKLFENDRIISSKINSGGQNVQRK